MTMIIKHQRTAAIDARVDKARRLLALLEGNEKLSATDINWVRALRQQLDERNWLSEPQLREFRLTGRDSLCPSGASFVSTMPPSPPGNSEGLAAK